MLSVDHVRARRKGHELVLTDLTGKTLEHAHELAEALLALTDEYQARSQEELKQAWQELAASARQRRLFDGLRKLVEDSCEFEVQTDLDPQALRSELFLFANEKRAQQSIGEDFEAASVVAEFAAQRNLEPAQVQRSLYADLKGAQVLVGRQPMAAPQLVERYQCGQVQAVLLKAVKVTVQVRCRAAHSYRELFRKLKFRRLIYTVQPLEDGRYRIEIDGPYSLFESITKYGLALALIVPALEECDHYELEAQLRWGKRREALVFRSSGGAGSGEMVAEARLPDEVDALVRSFERLNSPWRVETTATVIHLPGSGILVPDLAFVHGPTGEVVFFEAMGFWSREAVWQRVELAESGALPHKLLFAASARLRVSEEVLDDVEAASLYVYKGAVSPRAILKKLQALVAD